MRHESYTLEEVLAAHDRNEHFHGRQANMDKIQLYHSIKRELVKFVKLCDAAKQVISSSSSSFMDVVSLPKIRKSKETLSNFES